MFAVNSLKQIQGNLNAASKKKRLTDTIHSIDSFSQFSYSKPPSYSEFLTELDAACTEGDKLAQQAIERLAPEMAKELRRHKGWGKPKLCIEVAEGNVNVLQDADTLANPDAELPAKLIQHVLGSVEEYVQNSDSGPEEYSSCSRH